MPLSAGVWQDINPFRFVLGSLGQIGIFNINLGRSSDPEAERRILDEVGSYGRQLGRMGEALMALIESADLSKLSPEQQAAIEAFKVQIRDVQKAKTRAAAERGERRPFWLLPSA